jgi:two-component system, NarL family, response regulator LiaR
MGDRKQTVMSVLVVDDHRLIVKEVRRLLDEAGDFEVVAEATNGTEALVLAKRHRPDVVLLDLRMPGMDGLTCLDELQKLSTNMKVVMLSVDHDRALLDSALARGACGWIVKSVRPSDLAGAVRRAVESGLDSAVGLPDRHQPPPPAAKALSDRELRVLAEVARGKSNDAIAAEMGLASQTVKFHLTNLYRKLNVSNRTEAARYAYEHGMAEVHSLADGLG